MMQSRPALCRCAGAEMVAILRALFADFTVYDLSFPLLTFAWLHRDVVAVRLPEMVQRAPSFYSRFRQRGGHMQILSAADLAETLAEPARAAGGGRPAVVAVHAAFCGSLSVHLTGTHDRISILVNDPEDNPEALAALGRIGFRYRTLFHFMRPAEVESFCLLSRAPLAAEMIGRASAALDGIARSVRVQEPMATQQGSTLWIDLPGFVAAKEAASICPLQFVHDGSRVSEGDEAYSWLWIGQEKWIRLIVGKVPRSYGRMRVIVPKAFTSALLQRAALMLNGEVVQRRVEIWDEGMGAVGASLPANAADELVVGFSIPQTRAAADGSQLAACIDRLEFLAA